MRVIDYPRRVAVYLILLGAFFTFRGYRSLEGDQAYRLPILLHDESPAAYSNDPFVRSFDEFNPHRGSLALIRLASLPFGLSAGLVFLHGLTLTFACAGLDRLARRAWPRSGAAVGIVASGLALFTLAGNIGTNHLIEPILLDRQMAFALGWLAFSFLVDGGPWKLLAAATGVSIAGLIHPTLGCQLAMFFATCVAVWSFVPSTRTVGSKQVIPLAAVLFALAILPGSRLNLAGSGHVLEGVETQLVWLLSVELQSPQHMLPHSWRRPEWLAWGCFPALAVLALMRQKSCPTESVDPTRRKLFLALLIALAGLGASWVGIERLGMLRLALFQPFRMATVVRGLCLVLISGYWWELWNRPGRTGRIRAVLLGVGLTGDWRMVVVTLGELAFSGGDFFKGWENWKRWAVVYKNVPGWAVLVAGMIFLARHDTESGHLPLLASMLFGYLAGWLSERRKLEWSTWRLARIATLAWSAPVLALVLACVPQGGLSARTREVRDALLRRYRFIEVPTDDVERLSLWCREHLPPDALLVGPPGPKTLRLWSRRGVVFNRAGSPYNARDLLDWANRFRAHVGFDGPLDAFVRAYVRNRHATESGYERLKPAELVRLADRQGSGFIVASARLPTAPGPEEPGLIRLHTEGRYAVYQRIGPNVAAAGRNRPRR